jgi:hypothetical protein
MDSPFIYNNFVTGPDFISRQHELTTLTSMVKERRNILIYEPAKSGKQSIVQQSFLKLRQDALKFKVCEINLFNVRTEEALFQKYLISLVNCFSSSAQEAGKIHEEFSQISGKELLLDENGRYTDNPKMRGHFAKELVAFGEKLAEKNNILLITYIEEFQEILHFADPDDTLKLLESLWGKETLRNNTAFIISGSFVNAMKEIFEEKRYFYRMADRIKLERIDERGFTEYIIRSFLKAGRVVSKELATHIYKLTDGHPWYTQQLADIAFGLTRGYLTEAIINQAFDLLIELHSYRFRLITSRLSLFQLNLLKAILDNVEKLSSTEILSKYNLQSSANVNRLKDAVQKKEIVVFNKGKGEFLDPLFCTWMREIYFAE